MPLPPGGRIKYIGRGPSASTATGYAAVHQREQAEFVNAALDVNAGMTMV